jgi:hypothetical protein
VKEKSKKFVALQTGLIYINCIKFCVICGVFYVVFPGFAVVFESENEIAHVLLCKFWGYMYFISLCM